MGDFVRPPIPDHQPEPGYAYVAVPVDELPSNRWKLASGRQCRMMGGGRRRCPEPAVAAVNRGMRLWLRGNGRDVESWWHYCADHLYGRWIENGVLMIWVVRPVPSGGGTDHG